MGVLFIVRHSITGFNSPDPHHPDKDEKVRGWLDIPLSDEGWKHAEKTAEHLRDKGIVKIFSSDLKRAQETAEVISDEIDAPLQTTPHLRCWDVGVLEGKKMNDVRDTMMKYIKNPDAMLKGGEPYRQFYNRWRKMLLVAIKVAHKLPPDKAIAIVTHARNLYSLEHILSGGKEPIIFRGLIGPGGIIKLDLNQKPTGLKVLYNGIEEKDVVSR